MAAYEKAVKFDNGSTSVELGGIQVKHDWKNNLGEEPLPQENAGEKRTLALNMNRIIESFEVTVVIDDEVASEFNSSSDDKESIKNDFVSICESQDLTTLVYGDRTYKGYVKKFSSTERASEGSWQYKIKISFLVSEEMA